MSIFHSAKAVKWNIFFCVCLFLLNKMSLRFIHTIVCGFPHFVAAQDFIVWIYHYLSIHSFVEDIWVIFTLGLLWIKLLHSSTCLFCGYVSSVLLRICLGVVRLSHKASISLALVDIAKQFSKVIVPFSPPQAVYKISSCFTSSLTLYIVSHFNFSNSGACGISLWFWFPFPWLPIMPNIFSNTYWPSLLKSCSILLPI